MASTSLLRLFGNVEYIRTQLDGEFQSWHLGWDAEMKDQLFILENCNIKHKSSSKHSGNLLKDYLMEAAGGDKPLYLNMNVPQGRTAAVVGDSIRADLKNPEKIIVDTFKTKSTRVWAGKKSIINRYETGLAKIENLTIGKNKAKSLLDTAEAELKEPPAEKLEPNEFFIRYMSLLAKRNTASGVFNTAETELSTATLDLAKLGEPKADQNVATLTWRYISADLPTAADPKKTVRVSGWVPFEMTQPKRP